MDTAEKFALLKKELQAISVKAREYFESDDFSNEQKSDSSVVTRVDKEVEDILRTFITKHFPDDTFIGEEGDNKPGTSGFVWHVDPIDGTDNFLRKIPFCAISVARLGDTDEGTFALVHNPITNLTFSSYCGETTCENERLVGMTKEPLGGKYFVTVDRGRKPWMYPASHNLMTGLSTKFGRSKNLGSIALNLAYAAAGRFDAILTFGLFSYDYAAGLYLIKASGGKISVFEKGKWSEWTGTMKELCDEDNRTVFASHPEVHQQFIDFIGDPRRWEKQVLE
jgi:myo-inositol-1(or 4)-monophosphatase